MSKNWEKPIYFDLWGICQLKIYGEPNLVQAVRQELAYYQVDSQAQPLSLDLELELHSLKDFKPSPNPKEMPPYDFPGQYKLAKWMIRFERMASGTPRIKFYGNRFCQRIIAKQIVEPLIRWQAQKLGFIFLHSTCLVKENQGVLIAGSAGSGKTRLLLQWLKQGHPFLSDDFTILSYGTARGYVTPLRLGARLMLESGASQNLSFGKKAEIYARTILRNLLFNYARLQTKIDIKKLFPEIRIQDQVELKAVAVIEGAEPEIKKIPPEEMVEKLVKINQEEMYGFENYFSALAERTGDKTYLDFFSVQRQRLLEFLKGLPCFQIPLPSKTGFSALKFLSALLS